MCDYAFFSSKTLWWSRFEKTKIRGECFATGYELVFGYLVGEYDGAERLLRRAIEIMPRDPIVNDHYGDILWKLDRKIQAIYFWNNVLNFEETEDEMKEEIFYKLLKGPKKI